MAVVFGPVTRPARSDGMRPSVDAALRDDPVAWLSSVQADGRPHVAPVWFHWDGERIVAFSKPHARKIDNLRERPTVMLAVGTPGPEFDVELIEATAELPDRPASEVMPEGFGAKYRELLRRAGLSAQRFAEVYSQPIVLRPTRFLGYGGHGWQRSGPLAT
ncbi:MAG TPA: pyridoxamine 5'-phosphate oxidase family protein [Patescibacteria group bacterium]|nr:pyridoxamine 5'-phosphate oxidase family protein [Patescibacteria group bacterium]